MGVVNFAGKGRRKDEDLSFRYEQTFQLRVRWRHGVSRNNKR